MDHSFSAHSVCVVCVAGCCHQTTKGCPQRAAVDHWSTCSERPLWSLAINWCFSFDFIST